MSEFGPAVRRFSEHHGLLGTVIQMAITAVDEASGIQTETASFHELSRLQQVFNIFDPSSEIARWQRSEIPPGPEILEVLALAETWRRSSGGAFDVRVGAVRRLWQEAADVGRPPSGTQMNDALGNREPASIDLNGIAKGWIVDRAVTLALAQPGALGITINAGGDIRHEGPGEVQVAIEDPHRPFDNASPLQVQRLSAGAIASSGGARRGWEIDGKWFSHVIDPRSGAPVGHVAQATVRAATACEADVLATALTVLGQDERGRVLDAMDTAPAFLIVNDDGSIVSSPEWDEGCVS